MKRLALIAMSIAFAGAACGGSSSSTVDAPKSADAPATSSVKTVSCTGVTPAVTVTVTGSTTFAFSPSTPSIHVNDVIHFMTGSFHPVASGTPGSPDGKFTTNGDACLQFTEAGTFPFFCSVHLFTGTVTVQ